MCLWLAFGLLLCLGFAITKLPDGRVHLVFCDVGQGDAEIIIWKNIQVLIDGGPDEAKLEKCMAKYIPFWDRKLELVVSTHPEEDHLGALHAVAQKYQILNFLSTPASGSATSYFQLQKELLEKRINHKFVKQGDEVKIGGIDLKVLWPKADSQFDPQELNRTAIVLEMNYQKFCAYYMADVTSEEELALDGSGLLDKAELVKVAHHGSKTSSSAQFVAKLRPKLAIFEVGLKNRFRHPNEATLHEFDTVGASLLRTDHNGDIEVVTDGGQWWVKTEK